MPYGLLKLSGESGAKAYQSKRYRGHACASRIREACGVLRFTEALGAGSRSFLRFAQHLRQVPDLFVDFPGLRYGVGDLQP